MTDTDRQEELRAIEYIASMLCQLRLMAQSKQLNVLAYLIDMAHIEALENANQIKPSHAGRSSGSVLEN